MSYSASDLATYAGFCMLFFFRAGLLGRCFGSVASCSICFDRLTGQAGQFLNRPIFGGES